MGRYRKGKANIPTYQANGGVVPIESLLAGSRALRRAQLRELRRSAAKKSASPGRR